MAIGCRPHIVPWNSSPWICQCGGERRRGIFDRTPSKYWSNNFPGALLFRDTTFPFQGTSITRVPSYVSCAHVGSLARTCSTQPKLYTVYYGIPWKFVENSAWDVFYLYLLLVHITTIIQWTNHPLMPLTQTAKLCSRAQLLGKRLILIRGLGRRCAVAPFPQFQGR